MMWMTLPNLRPKPQSTGQEKQNKEEEKEEDHHKYFSYSEVIYLASLTIHTLAQNKGVSKSTSENLDRWCQDHTVTFMRFTHWKLPRLQKHGATFSCLNYARLCYAQWALPAERGCCLNPARWSATAVPSGWSRQLTYHLSSFPYVVTKNILFLFLNKSNKHG